MREAFRFSHPVFLKTIVALLKLLIFYYVDSQIMN